MVERFTRYTNTRAIASPDGQARARLRCGLRAEPRCNQRAHSSGVFPRYSAAACNCVLIHVQFGTSARAVRDAHGARRPMLIATPAPSRASGFERETNRVVVRLRAAVRRPPPAAPLARGDGVRDARRARHDGSRRCQGRRAARAHAPAVLAPHERPGGPGRVHQARRFPALRVVQAAGHRVRVPEGASRGRAFVHEQLRRQRGPATAYAGAALGVKTTVVVPSTTPRSSATGSRSSARASSCTARSGPRRTRRRREETRRTAGSSCTPSTTPTRGPGTPRSCTKRWRISRDAKRR